ncbi:MAG: hypothetical protein GXC73_14440 [Chitinophagaceae bacterium]|nr:hypothetical protein [Chitinophagaceae bacterium]
MQQAQHDFLQQLSSKLPPGQKLADAVGAVIGTSKSEAYKKMTGKTLLTLPQVQALCDHFNVNFAIHGQHNRSNSIISFAPFHTGKIGVKEYVSSLEKFLQDIAESNQRKLTCATDDIPLFHLFQYPELTAFKLHFWQMRVIDKAPFKFKMNDWGPSILKPAAHMHELYLQIPSVEVWTKTSLLNTLEQIQYAAEAGIITDKKIGRLICAQLRDALSNIEVYAVNHSKQGNKEVLFDWYFYDIIGTITYLAEMDGRLATYVRFNTFNTIREENGPLCTEVKHWLQSLIQDATGFSGQGSVHRNKYLAQAYEQCDAMASLF